MSNRQESNDDDYARRLQEEYRQDFVLRQARKRAAAMASAPSEVSMAEEQQIVPGVLEPDVEPTVVQDAQGFPFFSREAVEAAWDFPTFGTHTHRNNGGEEGEAPDDEAFARRLQAEIEREEAALSSFRRSNSNSRNRNPNTSHRHHNTSPDEDERMAQRLQEAENSMGNHRRSSRIDSHQSQLPNQHKQQDKPYNRSSSQITQRTDSDESAEGVEDTIFVMENERAARKIAQEMDDAEMAQRLALYEEEADRRRRQEARQQQQVRQSRSSRLLGRILPLVCCSVAVVVALLFVLGVLNPSDVPLVGDILNDPPDWIDPFNGGNGDFGEDVEIGGTDWDNPEGPPANDLMGWANNGRGISLPILNALSDEWQDYFGTAVSNWERGYPIDPLSLPTRRIPYEYDCEPVTGRLKTCNGDYGATRWRGLNELLLSRARNIIVASSAKMNEYYLEQNFDRGDQQLYTLCHELGHGFGLPHWDENFFNEDSGNCMDYTNNPGANKWPDESNFLYLAQIYGGVNITTGEVVTAKEARAEAAARGTPGPLTAVASRTDDQNDKDDKKDKEKNKKEKDRRLMERAPPRSLASWVAQIEAIEAAEQESSGRGLRAATASETLDSSVEVWKRRPGTRRRILHADKNSEVHWILDDPDHPETDEGVVRLEFYLITEEEGPAQRR